MISYFGTVAKGLVRKSKLSSSLYLGSQLDTLTVSLNSICHSTQQTRSLQQKHIHSKVSHEDDNNSIPSLRHKLEDDALHCFDTKDARRKITPSTDFAALLASHSDCSLQPGTPRYLNSAMESSPQARIIAELEYPHRIVWASSAWKELMGYEEEVVGKPSLALLLSSKTATEEASKVFESLHCKQRGCATIACKMKNHEYVPAAMTLSPLLCTNGSVSHMLFVVTPLNN